MAKIEVPILFFRRFKSVYHERRWVDFEKILDVRVIFSMVSRILLQLTWIVGGNGWWSLTEQYLEKGGPKNAQLAKEIFPYARTACIIFYIGRIVLVLLCLKWPRVCKYSLYYECLL